MDQKKLDKYCADNKLNKEQKSIILNLFTKVNSGSLNMNSLIDKYKRNFSS